MGRSVCLVLICFSLAACASLGPSAPSSGVSSEQFLDYQPIAPLPALRVLAYDAATHRFSERPWAGFPNTPEGNAEKRRLLPIQSAYTYIVRDDVSGGLSYLSNSAELARGDYTMISDYVLYRVERVEGEGVGLVGVGLRVRARIHTTRSGLNLGGLFALAVAAKRDQLSGELEVDVIGLSSKDIIQIFPAMSAEISPTSVAQVMQALAAIKAKIADPDVTLTPYLLAFKQSRPGAGSRIVASLAYVQGQLQGTAQLNQIDDIVAYLDGDDARWRRLVEASGLSDAQKRRWRDVAVRDVFLRLRADTAAGRGEVLAKLYAAYRGLASGGRP